MDLNTSTTAEAEAPLPPPAVANDDTAGDVPTVTIPASVYRTLVVASHTLASIFLDDCIDAEGEAVLEGHGLVTDREQTESEIDSGMYEQGVLIHGLSNDFEAALDFSANDYEVATGDPVDTLDD